MSSLYINETQCYILTKGAATGTDSLCVDVVLLCGDPLCGRLEKKCWITLSSDWLGTQMCSSSDDASTSALELFLLLDQSAQSTEK